MADKEEKTTSFLTGLLTGWGIKESWAKIIAGAVLGALAAAGILTTGCATTFSQSNADGSATNFTGTIIIPDNGK